MAVFGKFIVIEGMEGAGKSTAITFIQDILKQHQIEVITTREPGGTSQGEIVRSILKNPDFKGTMDARTELLLMYAARIQLIEEVIKPALKQGTWVLADRFELSTFAYQGGGRGLDISMINWLSQFSLNGFEPDLTIFMDVDPAIGMSRAAQRGQLDRFEQEPMDFFNKVYSAYHAQIKQKKNVITINASAELEQVLSSLHTQINQFMALHEHA